jgi:hypothetical protein
LFYFLFFDKKGECGINGWHGVGKPMQFGDVVVLSVGYEL